MRKKWSDVSRFFNERLFYKAEVMFVLSFENRADNNHLTISASKADSVVQIYCPNLPFKSSNSVVLGRSNCFEVSGKMDC